MGKITCPNGGLIHIAEARYGRTQSGYPKCETDKYTSSKDGPCFNNVKNLDCHLSSICKLKPENRKDPYGGDPCPGITKYLNVTYTCKMSKLITIYRVRDHGLVIKFVMKNNKLSTVLIYIFQLQRLRIASLISLISYTMTAIAFYQVLKYQST